MENIAWSAFDVLLIAATLSLAWASLTTEHLRRAVIFFIAFGLLLSLIWLRLKAPDVALAEAAIGAGLTGALLLAAVADHQKPINKKPDQKFSLADFVANTFLNLLFIAFAIVFGAAYTFALNEVNDSRLTDIVFQHLPGTGVTNPVTGVLLDFRAYDTMLELAVLLAAALGVMAIGKTRRDFVKPGDMERGLSQWLIPTLIILSLYLLWAGANAPGGAFQAAALLAAAGVVMRLTGYVDGGLPQGIWLRVLLVSGVGGFLLVSLIMMFAGRIYFDYPESWAGSLILLIESMATISIAATLVVAYLCGQPDTWFGGQQKENKHAD